MNEAIIWIFGHELKKNSMLTEDVKCEYELLKLFLAPNPPETLLSAVRNVVGLSQMMMAEKTLRNTYWIICGIDFMLNSRKRL